MTTAALTTGEARLALSGPLVAASLGPLWQAAMTRAAAAKRRGEALVIDISAAQKVDTAGATFLLALERVHDGARIEGASAQTAELIGQLRHRLADAPAMGAKTPRPAGSALRELSERVTFFGETILATASLPLNRRFLRVAEFARITDRAGVQAVALVVMLGFLIGMILAFQSAIPMRQFGADLYVADLVSISLFRELGPLLCAVILAGRTGSAFAAELGTMQVNEEIGALRTMGIDPATMLVLPRMAATMLVMPGLTVAIDIAGLLGMGFVLMLLGFPAAAITAHVAGAVNVGSFALGLVKAMVFGGVIALIGCRAGLTAGLGPRAVGEAATSAVVGGIVSTIVLDGIFAVFTYRLGL
jgi:phospholipid/cholesterol/gamma-HCH transport system permease protein